MTLPGVGVASTVIVDVVLVDIDRDGHTGRTVDEVRSFIATGVRGETITAATASAIGGSRLCLVSIVDTV